MPHQDVAPQPEQTSLAYVCGTHPKPPPGPRSQTNPDVASQPSPVIGLQSIPAAQVPPDGGTAGGSQFGGGWGFTEQGSPSHCAAARQPVSASARRAEAESTTLQMVAS